MTTRTMACGTATEVWLELLDRLMHHERSVSPRGMETREILGCASLIDMRYPVLTVPARKLSYEFMCAEARWILTGDNQVMTVAKHAPSITQFSDNGLTFFGAYGPWVEKQLEYVVKTLAYDHDSRQAVMTIWQQNPPKTKDVPCTVAVQWLIRDGWLHCIDTMRSSDLWLGWPYDVFNFTMLSVVIALELRARGIGVKLGTLQLNAGSQHLYERNFQRAISCVESCGINAWKMSKQVGPLSHLFWNDAAHVCAYLYDWAEHRGNFPEITWLNPLR